MLKLERIEQMVQLALSSIHSGLAKEFWRPKANPEYEALNNYLDQI